MKPKIILLTALLSWCLQTIAQAPNKQLDSLLNLPHNELTSNLHGNKKLLIVILENDLSVKQQVQALEKLALLQSLLEEHNASAATSEKLFRIYEQTGDELGLAWVYYTTGWRLKQRDHDKALAYLQKSIALFEKNKIRDKRLGEIYDNYGQILEHSGDLKQSLLYYQKSYAVKLETNDSLGLPYSLQKMGLNYAKQKETVKSERSFNDAIQIAKQLNDSLAIAETYAYMGDADVLQNKLTLAIYHFEKSLKISQEKNYPYLVKYNLEQLAALYEQTNQEKQALKYHKQFTAIKDSMLNVERQKAVSELEVAFDTAEKEREIESLSQRSKIQSLRNKLFAGLAFVGLLGVGLLALLRNRQKLKHKAELQQAEMSQLQAVIKAEEGEKERIARELHDGIGQLIAAAKMNVSVLGSSIDEQDRDIHENAMEIIDQTATEVRSLSHELLPASMQKKSWIELIQQQVDRMNAMGKIVIDFEHNQPQILDKSKTLHALRIVQELLKNGQKHAKTDKILLKIENNAQKTNIFYKDWGQGIPLDKIEESKGIGWRNINERVKALNGKIDVRNTQPGTEILVTW